MIRAVEHAQYRCARHGLICVTWETAGVPIGPRVCGLATYVSHGTETTACGNVVERIICTNC